MKTAAIRQLFLDYFKKHRHSIVASSSLIPLNDPTLLFTNAGMVQFKDVFLGNEVPSNNRACSAQRCVRAGGKHNDLENVGYTARHHTFFEMMGNFSFGDYFKREAIQLAWNFVTQELKLSPQKLWVTVHESDNESAEIWLNEIQVDPQRFSRCGDADNYWSMGNTGPCGPCTEIFYDHGPDVPGGPPGSPDQEGDRYIEIWNIVFMQNDRHTDGTLHPLPKPSVDTGMGLERVAAILQGVHTNYEIDLFQNLISALHAILSKDKISLPSNHQTKISVNVIVDHIRSTAFLIADGVLPSNEGRGYVLRRIIRRAARHGQQIGLKKPFLCRLVAALVSEMGAAYPSLKSKQAQITQTLEQEEKQFAKTIQQGLALLDDALAELPGDTLAGDVVFKLYDTYGFPADLTADIARERNIKLDMADFEKCMQVQRERSQQASQFNVAYQNFANLDVSNKFVGYDDLRAQAKLLALIQEGDLVQEISAPSQALVILDKTPFYAESGGQVGDQGELLGEHVKALVTNTTKEGQLHIHHLNIEEGHLAVGDIIMAQVSPYLRKSTQLNHSATHLLHAALRKILGEHVQQKGSLVTPDKLRFDFTHNKALTQQALNHIEQLVNEQIRANHTVSTATMSKERALSSGAMALFNEKYGDTLRVLTMGDFSCEICGGTHVLQTGDIGFFKIISESSIASGVRRIEGCTGQVAIDVVQQQMNTLSDVTALLQTDPTQILEKLQQTQQQLRDLTKQLDQLKAKAATNKASELVAQVETIDSIKLLVTECNDINKASLRNLLDDLKQRLQTAVIVLAVKEQGRVHLITGVTQDIVNRINAAELIKMLAEQLGGKGGGRADMAQAGGDNVQALSQALASVKPWVEAKLN